MQMPDFKLERFFAKYEFSTPYLLCSSDPQSFSLEELLSYEPKSIESLKKQWLGYTESQGHPELRGEIANLYETIKPDEVLVTSGAEEGIFLFANAVLKPKDHVIAMFPAYQSLYETSRFRGCEVTLWKVEEENNWELDLNFLKQNIKKNTKAIIINCPHNPTGYLMNEEKLLEIVKVAKENNIYILSDEVYRYLEYDRKDRLPAVCDIYENGISIAGMSKAFALPGLRICWAVTHNKEIFKKISAFKDYTTICCSAPSEFLATLAIKNKEKILKRNLAIIQGNLKTLKEFFKKHKDIFSYIEPKAGMIMFPRINLDTDIEKLCLDLISKQGVFILPSTVYDYGNKNFRIGFGRTNMSEALSKFENYIEKDLKVVLA